MLRGLSWSWSYGSWIYNYLCNQCPSPLALWGRIRPRRGVLNTTLCDKVCYWLATGLWFSPGTPVSSTNKTNCHNITEILLKVSLNTITVTLTHCHDILVKGSRCEILIRLRLRSITILPWAASSFPHLWLNIWSEKSLEMEMTLSNCRNCNASKGICNKIGSARRITHSLLWGGSKEAFWLGLLAGVKVSGLKNYKKYVLIWKQNTAYKIFREVLFSLFLCNTN